MAQECWRGLLGLKQNSPDRIDPWVQFAFKEEKSVSAYCFLAGRELCSSSLFSVSVYNTIVVLLILSRLLPCPRAVSVQYYP